MKTEAIIIGIQYADQINPELREVSPWLNDVVAASDGLMNKGIDPSLAIATIAAVPVVLKVLNMINQFTVAAIDDWRDGQKIKREKERLELEALRDRVPHSPAPGAPRPPGIPRPPRGIP